MARAKGRGRGRGTRGGRGRGRGRNKKMIIDSDEEQEMDTSDAGENQGEAETVEEEENSAVEDPVEDTSAETNKDNKDNSVEFNIDDDISQLVPPTFSTISKGPPQPMVDLSWDHQYFPLGEKVASPNIHMCISCRLPIRLYGRLIPCKHVFCYSCAVKQGDRCSCCDDRVTRIEKAPLGNVFMCLHGGIQYGYEGCRRTYLSQRDLQAHFNHRHKPRPSGSSSNSSSTSTTTASTIHDTPVSSQGGGANTGPHRQNIPVHFSSSRSNLISVPLQLGPSNVRSVKDSHSDGRFDNKKSHPPYSRPNNPSGWGSFRPY